MTQPRLAPGCRRLTPAHVHVQAIAEGFTGLPEGVSKGQALAAFKRAAPPLGLSSRLRDAIDALFAFSEPQDWHQGRRPIVWPSNRKLEAALGLGCRQVQNVLTALIRARLITPVDSPTGRRWGRRDTKTGVIVEAYGFDLSPIGRRHDEFLALAERAAFEERERAALRRRLTIARKAIRQIAESALEHGLTGRDWRFWLAEAEGRALTLPTEPALAALREVVIALEERRDEGEAALREAFDSVQSTPSGALECTPITTTTQPQADKSATRKSNSQNGHSGPANRAHTNTGEASPDDPPAPTPRLVIRVSPPLQDQLLTPSPSWPEVVEAADRLRYTLGISRAAWIAACQALGRYQAATAVAIIAAKGGAIRSPGGYLRGMIARAHAGELHLVKSLWGLARHERSAKPYDA